MSNFKRFAWIAYASDDGVPVMLTVRPQNLKVACVFATKAEAQTFIKLYKKERGHIPLAIRKINLQ